MDYFAASYLSRKWLAPSSLPSSVSHRSNPAPPTSSTRTPPGAAVTVLKAAEIMADAGDSVTARQALARLTLPKAARYRSPRRWPG
jgi:hypothetical protein